MAKINLTFTKCYFVYKDHQATACAKNCSPVISQAITRYFPFFIKHLKTREVPQFRRALLHELYPVQHVYGAHVRMIEGGGFLLDPQSQGGIHDVSLYYERSKMAQR
jgi:hypothetical protein